MTNSENFEKLMHKNFVHEPTSGQSKLMKQLTAFCFSEKENCVFLLKGYAGTGKTSIVGALVNTLPSFNINYVLLAPTYRLLLEPKRLGKRYSVDMIYFFYLIFIARLCAGKK